MEVACSLTAIASDEFTYRLYNQDEGYGGHEEAESDVAGGLDARFAAGEAAWVDAVYCAVTEEEGEITMIAIR